MYGLLVFYTATQIELHIWSFCVTGRPRHISSREAPSITATSSVHCVEQFACRDITAMDSCGTLLIGDPDLYSVMYFFC